MHGAHGLRKVGEFLRNVFARETLGAEPEDPPPPRRARTIGRALFEIEELAEDPPPRPRARAPAAREALPPEPPPAPRTPRGPGVLRALFVPEHLPEDPAEPPRARHRWLAWLFRPESLDPPWR